MTQNHRNRHGTTATSNDPAITVYYLSELKLAVAPVKGQAVNILKTTHQVLNVIHDYDTAAVFTDTTSGEPILQHAPNFSALMH
jgi:hypothetical protein